VEPDRPQRISDQGSFGYHPHADVERRTTMGAGADNRATERAKGLVGKTIDGRYQIDGILAMGGMGAVYLARHLKLKKRVAVKALHPDAEDHPELVMRFEREALAGAQVSHQNVASATDFGDLADGTRYLVMEYVRGESLRAAIDREAPFGPQRAVLIARQVAVALREIHARGIVHRDIKPRNVMLAEGDFVKVVDFGLAKIDGARFSALPPDEAEEDSRLTGRGVIFGTVEYLAPEAAFGMELVDARADLYAVGVMLYEMLAGKHPFDAKNEAEFFTKQRLAEPPPIHERSPAVSVEPQLEAVVQKLLSKDPDTRYQTAEELITALDKAEPAGSLAPEEPADAPLSSARIPPTDVSPPSAVAEPPERVITRPKERPREIAPESRDSPSGAFDGHRNAFSPPAKREIWRTTPALFVVGTLLGLLVVYFVVRRSLENAPAPGSATTEDEAPHSAIESATSLAVAPPEPIAPSQTPAESASASPEPSADDSERALKEALSHGTLDNAVDAGFALLAAAPTATRDPSRAQLLSTLLGRVLDKEHAKADTIWRAVALSSGGPDLLYRFVELGGSRSAVIARGLLRDPEVRSHESKALAIAFGLRDLPCNGKLALIDDAVKFGDERALLGLDMVARGCVKDPKTMERPIKDLRARLDKEKAGG
jgi:serine/threonine protein kinase